MLLDVPVLINLETICQQREALQGMVLQRENQKRFFHNYVVAAGLSSTHWPKKMPINRLFSIRHRQS
jgi:hypothetical protein